MENNKKSIQNVKIFKTANDMSTMDVTASLDYYKTNKDKEDVYKGKVIFGISAKDPSNSKKYLHSKAFVDKAKTKVLMQAIIDHTFGNKVFKGGFSDFGGTINSDPSKIRSRILKVNLTDRGQYVFSLDEGKGKVGDKGSIQMLGKPEISVKRFIPYEEALQMAHEVYDYIRDQEMLALMNGKPLYTLTHYEGNTAANEVSNQVEGEEQTQAEAPVAQQEVAEQQEVTVEEYVITVDPWKGKKMSDLTNDELKYILQKTKDVETEIAQTLYKEAINEVKKRMAKAQAS